MKFEIKDTEGGYNIKPKSDDILIELRFGNHGAIHLKKSNIKNQSYCYQRNASFAYHGTSNPLIDKPNKIIFTPQRIVMIQMK